jgi:flagellar biosynthesis chaperone FliJ
MVVFFVHFFHISQIINCFYLYHPTKPQIMKRSFFVVSGRFLLIMTIAVMSTISASAGDHPAYLKALADLRAARWLIDHRPAQDWRQSADEASAVSAIDAAINEIKKAAIDDHKDINDHVGVQEIPDRMGRLQKALQMLQATRNDIAQREDDRFALGLRARAFQQVDAAIGATQRAIQAPSHEAHPAYLQALADLRAARWLISNHPSSDWMQSADEGAAVSSIDGAINEIKKAAIDDHKDINDHTGVQEIPDRMGRLQKALQMLQATRNNIAQREDDRFAQGLRARAFQQVDAAISATQHAIQAPSHEAHPAYLQALADLRAARWLVDHRPNNGWQPTGDETNTVRAIDAAMNEIKKAAIDDHKDVNDHTSVQEIPDRGGRMHRALYMLRATRKDVAQREDDNFAQGLKARALQHIDDAIRSVQQAIQNF